MGAEGESRCVVPCNSKKRPLMAINRPKAVVVSKTGMRSWTRHSYDADRASHMGRFMPFAMVSCWVKAAPILRDVVRLGSKFRAATTDAVLGNWQLETRRSDMTTLTNSKTTAGPICDQFFYPAYLGGKPDTAAPSRETSFARSRW